MHERGQATTEYVMLMVGVVALAALLLAAMPRLAPAISGDVRALVCRVAGGDCSAAPALPAVGTPPAEDWYRQFVDAGPRGALLADINDPTDAEFAALVDQGDTYLNGGETSRRSFTVAPQPGRGVVAIDFFSVRESRASGGGVRRRR